jgi:hypothetical protein
VSSVENLIKDNASRVVEDMTYDLRSRAKKSGWSKELVSSMQVAHQNDDINVVYPEKKEEELYDSEYGSMSEPHKAAIRPFSYNLDKYLTQIIDDTVIDAIITETRAFHG